MSASFLRMPLLAAVLGIFGSGGVFFLQDGFGLRSEASNGKRGVPDVSEGHESGPQQTVPIRESSRHSERLAEKNRLSVLEKKIQDQRDKADECRRVMDTIHRVKQAVGNQPPQEISRIEEDESKGAVVWDMAKTCEEETRKLAEMELELAKARIVSGVDSKDAIVPPKTPEK